MLQQPTSKEHKKSSQGPTMPNTAEMHLKWVKKYGGRIHCGIQNKIAEKGPKWYGPYEVAERKDDGNGNYLLKSLSGKNKGQISKKSYPPNHLKRFIHRNPEIPGDSDSEYGSDNEDSVPASQDSDIGSQESVPENPSHISSDAMTVLYPNPEEGDTLLSCTLIDDPGHTLPKMMAYIPIHTPSCGDDEDAFLPDLVETEPTTPSSSAYRKNTFSSRDTGRLSWRSCGK